MSVKNEYMRFIFIRFTEPRCLEVLVGFIFMWDRISNLSEITLLYFPTALYLLAGVTGRLSYTLKQGGQKIFHGSCSLCSW